MDVAIRPENILFDDAGELKGVLETHYYLGEVDDCRVRGGEALVRVIADGYGHADRQPGQRVRLSIRSFMVFEDDGSLERMLEIQT